MSVCFLGVFGKVFDLLGIIVFCTYSTNITKKNLKVEKFASADCNVPRIIKKWIYFPAC